MLKIILKVFAFAKVVELMGEDSFDVFGIGSKYYTLATGARLKCVGMVRIAEAHEMLVPPTHILIAKRILHAMPHEADTKGDPCLGRGGVRVSAEFTDFPLFDGSAGNPPDSQESQQRQEVWPRGECFEDGGHDALAASCHVASGRAGRREDVGKLYVMQ